MKTKQLLIAAICCLFAITSAYGQSYGTTGELSWNVSSNTLTISGHGAMPGYSIGYTPWKEYQSTITSVKIESGVTSIGSRAFSSCSKLTSVTLPEGLKAIGSDAFYSCGVLTSITIPQSVKSIDYRAFYICSNLAEINILNDEMAIGEEAFDGTAWYNSAPNDEIAYLSNVIAYKYKGNVSQVASIELWENTRVISTSAFSGCRALTSITIPQNVKIIGEKAFYNCTSLSEITILNSYTAIAPDAFLGTAWYNAQVEGELLYIDGMLRGYKGDLSHMTNISIAEGITIIPNNFFSEAVNLSYVTIPRSVTFIGSEAFKNCTKLTSITIPENVEEIGENAFAGCTNLKTVTWLAKDCSLGGMIFPVELKTIDFGKNVESIPSYICMENTAVTTVAIPHSVKTIGEKAFFRCTKLYGVVLGAGLTHIGDLAFYGCTGLDEIISFAITPPVATPYCFLDVPITANVQIPCGTIPLYEAANEWKYFLDYTEIIAYVASCYSSNAEYGMAYVQQTCAEAVFMAEPLDGCKFVRWSDGSESNPLIVPLSDHIELVAEFEAETTGIGELTDEDAYIYVDANHIVIEQNFLPVAIYDSTGRVLYQGLDRAVAVENNGVYIVEIEGKRKKVIVGN